MTKEKDKGQTMIYKILHRKLKTNKTNPTKIRGCTQVLRKREQFRVY